MVRNVKLTLRRGRTKRQGRRRRFRGRSILAKRARIRKMLNTHLHRRWAEMNTVQLTAETAGPIFFSHQETFKLSNLVNYTELTQLYDQYKINFVEIFIMWSPDYMPIATSTTAGERANLIPPSLKIFHLPDYDDDGAMTKAEFKERAKTKLMLLKPQQRRKIVVKPAVLSQIYETLTSTGYAPKWGVKLDSADPSVPHYSYKFGVELPQVVGGSSNIELGRLTFEFRYNLTCYNTK